MRREKNADKLVPNSLRADGADRLRLFNNRIPGDGLDLKLQQCGKADGAQKSQAIFSESLCRIANRPNDPCRQIFASAHKIDHLAVRRIVKHAVDREVPPTGIFFRRGKVHVDWMSAIEVSAIRAKGGDFK